MKTFVVSVCFQVEVKGETAPAVEKWAWENRDKLLRQAGAMSIMSTRVIRESDK